MMEDWYTPLDSDLPVVRRISFDVEFADVRHSYRLWYVERLKTPRAAVTYIAAGVIVIGMAWIGGDFSGSGRAGGLIGASFGAVIGCIAVIALSLFAIDRVARRHFAQQRTVRLGYDVDWEDAGLTVTTANSRIFHPWGDFLRWRQSEHVILLFQTDAMFNFIPTRALAPAQLADLREAVAQGIGSR